MKDFLSKHWSLITGIAAMLFTAAIWLIDFGANNVHNESRWFDTPEQKSSVILTVESSPTPEQRVRERILDSINTIEAIRSRRLRDKMFLQQDSLRKITDSINRLNADQLYQIKQELKELKNKQ